MLAGAYSKTYRALEQQHVEHLKQLAENERTDSLARTKKLSFETNKRRKAQAVKRKLEQQREEKRRQHILTKRREQQRQATEKYQRSHLPARPQSHRSSPTRRGNVTPTRTLDETLQLVRGGSNSGLRRQNSGGSSGNVSPHQNYNDALNKPYFNKYSNFQRPVSPPERTHEGHNRNRLHNKSLHNLNNSKSLFEQQLEQQQRKLFDQQQQALNEFNEAIVREIVAEKSGQVAEEDVGLMRSDSLSSVDSLEGSQDSLLTKYQNDNNIPDKTEESHRDLLTNSNENVIRTSRSGVLSHDTHQNVREISAQLGKSLGQSLYRPQPEVHNGQIDSYNVDQTSNYGAPQAGSNNAPKQDFQSVYQNGVTNTKDRPKVHVRAWATPSPVDGSHVTKALTSTNTQVTNSNPYTSRNTMTTVTTTTKFDSNKGNGMQQQYVQSNGWSDERNNLQGQYTSKPQYDPNKQFDQSGQDNSRVLRPQGSDIQGNATKNLEFLETVTNTMDKQEAVADAKPAMTPSRVPRPVSGTRRTEQYTTIPAPSYVPTNNNGAVESNSQGEHVGINHMTSTQGQTPKQQVFVNTNSGERPQVRQVTQVKFAANVVNGNVHMANYGRLQVLPDKPNIGIKQTIGYTNGGLEHIENSPVKTTKDDAEIHQYTKASDTETNEIKSILKRRGKTAGMGAMRRAGSTGSVNKGFDIKDSIELTRVQMTQAQQIPKKKSVRFADLHYSDEGIDDTEEEEDRLFIQRKPGAGSTTSKPPRPVSAKVVSQNNKTESKAPRVASAGSRPAAQQKHKSTIRPQATAHIIAHNASASALIGNHLDQSLNDKKVSVVNDDFMSKVPVTSALKSSVNSPAITEATVYSVPGMRMNYAVSPGGIPNSRQEQVGLSGKENNMPPTSANVPSFHSDAHLNQNGHVYNENGLRIDRTPTDDEINFLWDKVRTCLHRTPTSAPSPNVTETQRQQTMANSEHLSRQAAPLSHTYIDGAALSQINSSVRVAPPMQNQQNGAQAYNRKTGSDVGVYQRRLGLLQQRKQQNPNNLNKNGTQQREFITYHGPVFSNLEPSQNVASAYQPPQDASDSMAAFLTAEHLAQQSVTESQIQQAMDEAQRKQQAVNAGKPVQKVPSALSIEEQRLLESLDRLNERLKITEFPGAMLQEQQAYSPQDQVPQAFVYGGAFRGHQPINSQKRTNEGNRGVFRGGSSIRLQKKP